MATGTPNAIGGQTVDYTNENGSVINFCEGFNAVRASAACNVAGVDAEKMVRGITLNGKELIVDAAPEHTTAGDIIYFPDIALHEVGGTTTQSMVATNPSDCRDMRVLVYSNWNINFLLDPPTNPATLNSARVGQEILINGVQNPDVTSIVFGGTSGGYDVTRQTTGLSRHNLDSTFGATVFPITIPAGGSSTITIRIEETIPRVGYNRVFLQSSYLGWFGSTI